MNSEPTPVSCGVDFIYGFEHEAHDASMEELCEAVAYAMWAPAYMEDMRTPGGKPRLSAAIYTFSDIKGHNGDRFGEYMMGLYPDRVVRMEARNPNSGNPIVTYMWRPSSDLHKLPGWARGRRRALEERKTGSWW